MLKILVPIVFLGVTSLDQSVDSRTVRGLNVKVCSDSVLLLADDFENLNFVHLPVYKLSEAPGGGYMLSVRSFDIDLNNEQITADLNYIEKLPLFHQNRSVEFNAPSIVKMQLFKWATVAYLDYDCIEKNGTTYSINRDYITIYARIQDQLGRLSWKLVVPRKKVS